MGRVPLKLLRDKSLALEKNDYRRCRLGKSKLGMLPILLVFDKSSEINFGSTRLGSEDTVNLSLFLRSLQLNQSYSVSRLTSPGKSGMLPLN